WEIDRGRWRLAKRKTIALGGASRAGPFASCKKRRASLPKLETLFALEREKLATEDIYDLSATVACFLLEGEHRRYRSAFLKLLETVHKVRDDEKTLETFFPDRSAMQDEWL